MLLVRIIANLYLGILRSLRLGLGVDYFKVLSRHFNRILEVAMMDLGEIVLFSKCRMIWSREGSFRKCWGSIRRRKMKMGIGMELIVWIILRISSWRRIRFLIVIRAKILKMHLISKLNRILTTRIILRMSGCYYSRANKLKKT